MKLKNALLHFSNRFIKPTKKLFFLSFSMNRKERVKKVVDCLPMGGNKKTWLRNAFLCCHVVVAVLVKVVVAQSVNRLNEGP